MNNWNILVTTSQNYNLFRFNIELVNIKINKYAYCGCISKYVTTIFHEDVIEIYSSFYFVNSSIIALLKSYNDNVSNRNT